jgi:hypothetical protein
MNTPTNQPERTMNTPTPTPKNDQPTYAMLADMRDRALIAERELTAVTEQRDSLQAQLERSSSQPKQIMIKINKADGTQEIVIKLEHDLGDLWYATNSQGVVYQTTLDDIITPQQCDSQE